MSVRVSTEYIAVLGQKTGETRCTQYYIEALVDEQVVYEQSPSSAMALTDDAVGELADGSVEVDASSDIAFDDAAESFVIHTASASNAISFVDEAYASAGIEVEASSVMDISDVALRVMIRNRSLEDDFDPTDAALGGKVISKSASNVLTLTDLARRVVTAIAADEIEFNFEAVATGQLLKSASSTLTLSDLADSGFKFAAASNALTLDQTVRLAQVFAEGASNSLTFTDEALPGLIVVDVASLMDLIQLEAIGDLNNNIRRAVSSMAVFVDNVASAGMVFNRSLPSEVEVLPGSKYLNLTHSVSYVGPKVVSASSTMALHDTAAVATKTITRSLSSLLSFSQKVGRIKEQSVSSIINLTHKAERRQYVSSVMTLSDVVSAGAARAASSVLNLTDTLARNFVFSRKFEHDLEITDSVTFELPRDNTECIYSPFGGSGSQVSPTVPALAKGLLTLVFESTTLELRNPDFNNISSVASDRINRQSRGGSIQIFNDPKWPRQQTLKVSISALNEEQVTNFLMFLAQSVGQEIQLTDWEDRTWLGIVTTPDAIVTRNKDCSHKLSFEFEGELQ